MKIPSKQQKSQITEIEQQLLAVAGLMRSNHESKAFLAAKAVLVDGMTQKAAKELYKCSPSTVSDAVTRYTDAIESMNDVFGCSKNLRYASRSVVFGGEANRQESGNMSYEQIVHDQALYCATEALELHRQLGLQSRQPDSRERRMKAGTIESRLSNHGNKCYMLSYMYEAAGRTDLQQLILELSSIVYTEAPTALMDPDGWEETCAIGGQNPADINVEPPEDELRHWRLQFLAAIQTKL